MSSSNKKHNYSRVPKKSKSKLPQLGENLFVERDYGHGVATRFVTDMPAVLLTRNVEEQRFASTVEQVNDYFERAEQVGCGSFVEGLMGLLSCYSIFLCSEPKSYHIYRDMRDFIIQENQSYYQERGLEILDPISNGLIGLEFKVHPEP